MGMRLFGGSSSGRSSIGQYAPNDPRPNIFKIEHLQQIGRFTIGIVNYPHSDNFEGDKILVWENATIDEISNLNLIDPHFLENNKIFARFRPTTYGWEAAKLLCISLG